MKINVTKLGNEAEIEEALLEVNDGLRRFTFQTAYDIFHTARLAEKRLGDYSLPMHRRQGATAMAVSGTTLWPSQSAEKVNRNVAFFERGRRHWFLVRLEIEKAPAVHAKPSMVVYLSGEQAQAAEHARRTALSICVKDSE